ncbi:IS200/IS605 family transposase, partial [Clostridium haemolyticum]|uniref:IS200/IS605 family transposase n=1 Tax=Clostridium haemolyticum TaxID=84025 RepID=UPI003C7D090C
MSVPKFRRREIYGDKKIEIGKILRQLCEWKGVEIIEANACIDHIHMLVSIPPKMSISSFVGFLKGKSSLMIFEKFANLRYRYGNRHFWAEDICRYSRRIKSITEYIKINKRDIDIRSIRLKMMILG